MAKVSLPKPRGYIPVVICNDCYPRQEEVGVRCAAIASQGSIEKSVFLFTAAVSFAVAAEDNSVTVTHTRSGTSGEHKMKAK